MGRLDKYKSPEAQFGLALHEGNKHIQESPQTHGEAIELGAKRPGVSSNYSVSNCVAQDQFSFWASETSLPATPFSGSAFLYYAYHQNFQCGNRAPFKRENIFASRIPALF